MRLMVREVLIERFKLGWHLDQREESVLQLVLAKAGEVGPQLETHTGDVSCVQGKTSDADASLGLLPCGSAGLMTASSPGRSRISGRAEPIARLAALLSKNNFAGIERPAQD
jgi:uncharacterized protein (TIGR03435 family)